MTEEEKKAVEAKEQEAATVQKSELELKLEAKESELKQVKLDKENYRKLGLKYKKADELDKEATSDTDEDLDSRVERIIAGRLLDNQEKRLLSEKIKSIRSAKGLAQERLALEACVDRTLVSKIERQIANPSLETLVKLAMTLKVPVSTLIE